MDTHMDTEQHNISSTVRAAIAFEKRPENRLRVCTNLDNPHPYVRNTNDAFRQAKPDMYGRVAAHKAGCLDINVGPENVQRALCIMETLIRNLPERGGAISIKPAECYTRQETIVIIADEKIAIGIYEPSIQSRHVLTPKERRDKARGHGWYIPKFDYVPCGALVLKIKEWGNAPRREFCDSKKNTVENVLNEFICALWFYAEKQRIARIQREIVEQRKTEFERRQKEIIAAQEQEHKRLMVLVAEVEEWERANLLRRYCNAITENYVRKHGAPNQDDKIVAQLAWIKEQADKMDPLMNDAKYGRLNST